MTPADTSSSSAAKPGKGPAARAAWLKQLHQWHWISSAICLIGMILFAVTGITLNHAADIESKPAIVGKTAQLPTELAATLKPRSADEASEPRRGLPRDAAPRR